VLLYNVARLHDRAGDLVRAREHYERYLREEKDLGGLARGRAKLDALLARVPGSLEVTTEPTGAEVEVDGIAVGRSPAVVAEAKRGIHDVVARLPGYRPASARVPVEPGARAALALALSPATVPLTVACDCPGARVELDGRAIGMGPLDLPVDVAPGTHTVTVVPFVGDGLVQSVEVPIGGPARVDIRLRIDDAVALAGGAPASLVAPLEPPTVPPPAPEEPPPGPDPIPEPVPAPAVAKAAWRASPWQWVAIGTGAASIVAGGVLTALAARDRDRITGAPTENGISTMTRTEALSIRRSAETKDKASYALYAVGGAAVATGIVLWIVDATRPGAGAAAQATMPVVSATQDSGWAVGATGRF
jgi:hypothetical protein